MFQIRTVRLSGGAIIILTLVGALVLVLATSLLVVLASVLGILLALTMLHLVVLPRLLRRLNLAPLVLSVLLLPVVLGLAWLVTGTLQGVVLGSLIWLVGLAGPQLALVWLRRRLAIAWSTAPLVVHQRPTAGTDAGQVLEAVRCRRCGRAWWAATPAEADECPHCSAPAALLGRGSSSS